MWEANLVYSSFFMRPWLNGLGNGLLSRDPKGVCRFESCRSCHLTKGRSVKYVLALLLTFFTIPSASKESKIQKLFDYLNQNASKCLTTRNQDRCDHGEKSKYQGTGWCYKYVKLALLKAGMVSKYLGGGSAIDAGPYLKKEGFVNIMKEGIEPSDAPIGSILVFKVEANKHGHIEVKTDEDTYVSDYIRHKHPDSYELIGVYYKPKQPEYEGYLIAL